MASPLFYYTLLVLSCSCSVQSLSEDGVSPAYAPTHECSLFHPSCVSHYPFFHTLSFPSFSLGPAPTLLVSTALWLRWSHQICSPTGSNKSAPLHAPTTPYRPPSCSSPPIDALVARPPPSPSSLHTCVHFSPRFALLDHVRMSSPTALTRFTLERLLCREYSSAYYVPTACPGTITITCDGSRILRLILTRFHLEKNNERRCFSQRYFALWKIKYQRTQLRQ